MKNQSLRDIAYENYRRAAEKERRKFAGVEYTPRDIDALEDLEEKPESESKNG